MQCIYCLIDKPKDSFSKVEHVIPQSFGLFKKNFTLIDMVCDECNQYFGDNLEIALARDTFEGASRFDFNVKEPKGFKSLGKQSRMIIRVVEGECKGSYAYREYSREQNKVVLMPMPQIGFMKTMSSEKQYEYFLLNEVPDKRYLEENGFELSHPGGIRILGADVGTAQEILRQKGVMFQPQSEAGPPENQTEDWLCKVEGVVDDIIFRAIAKIAFNYLTYWQGVDFLLHKSFDPTRQYIRKGQRTSYPLIKALNKPILADEPVEGKQRLGHIITVDWAADKVSIVSQVSLFNWATYVVSLAGDFPDEHRVIRSGHFFNTHSQEIIPLEAR